MPVVSVTRLRVRSWRFLPGFFLFAMRKLLEWCDEAALVRWTQPESELPVWTEAHRRLVQEGRPSKVNHPSQAHTSYSIPLPAGGAKREVRLK